MKSDSKTGAGIIISGGGFKYLPAAWVGISWLRKIGVKLPIELWMAKEEVVETCSKAIESLGVTIKILDAGICPKATVPKGLRWQWVFKPAALLQSRLRHIILLDADNFGSSGFSVVRPP